MPHTGDLVQEVIQHGGSQGIHRSELRMSGLISFITKRMVLKLLHFGHMCFQRSGAFHKRAPLIHGNLATQALRASQRFPHQAQEALALFATFFCRDIPCDHNVAGAAFAVGLAADRSTESHGVFHGARGLLMIISEQSKER